MGEMEMAEMAETAAVDTEVAARNQFSGGRACNFEVGILAGNLHQLMPTVVGF